MDRSSRPPAADPGITYCFSKYFACPVLWIVLYTPGSEKAKIANVVHNDRSDPWKPAMPASTDISWYTRRAKPRFPLLGQYENVERATVVTANAVFSWPNMVTKAATTAKDSKLRCRNQIRGAPHKIVARLRIVGTTVVLEHEGSIAQSYAVRNYKVAVVGAAGGIGQPLSLLLKLDRRVTNLSLYDVAPVTPGVAADISHVCSPAKVTGFTGKDQMAASLKDSDIVIIPAGVPRKPGMTRDDLFNINASIVQGIAEACVTACPNAFFLIISNPVNSTVPIFAETLKKHGVYDKKRLFGVTSLDVVRANTFVAENQKLDVNNLNVPVIGGHAGTTILPLLSQVPGARFSEEDIKALTHRIQFGGDEVVAAKAGAGSATLSMAYAGQWFASRLISALAGDKNVVECAFVENDLTSAPFFATKVRLGPRGVEEVLPFGKLSAFEQDGLDKLVPDLIVQAKKGVEFAKK